MDIDTENKKRKVDDEQVKEPKKLEDILTRHLDSKQREHWKTKDFIYLCLHID